MAASQPIAYVSPSIDGWVGLFDSKTEGEADPAQTVLELSKRFRTHGIAFRSDDGDYLHYVLADRGELVDRYHSNPGLIMAPLSDAELAALDGKPMELCRAAGVPSARSTEVSGVLRKISTGELGALEGLLQLGRLLGIPNVGATWSTMEWDPRGTRDLRGWERFVRIMPEDLPRAPEPSSPIIREADLPMPKRVATAPSGLPVEVVARPATDDSAYTVWVAHYPAQGPQFREQIIRSVAAELSEVKQPADCMVWMDEVAAEKSPFPRPALRLFFVFARTSQETQSGLLERVALGPFPATRTRLSENALPTLKRAADGTVIRLWEPGTSKAQPQQRVTSDWTTFTLHNRVFDISR